MAEKGVAAAYGALSQALLLLVPSLQRQLVLLNPRYSSALAIYVYR